MLQGYSMKAIGRLWIVRDNAFVPPLCFGRAHSFHRLKPAYGHIPSPDGMALLHRLNQIVNNRFDDSIKKSVICCNKASVRRVYREKPTKIPLFLTK
jgi:hypothetical protein